MKNPFSFHTDPASNGDANLHKLIGADHAHEDNAAEGDEFIDDALRMVDQALEQEED